MVVALSAARQRNAPLREPWQAVDGDFVCEGVEVHADGSGSARGHPGSHRDGLPFLGMLPKRPFHESSQPRTNAIGRGDVRKPSAVLPLAAGGRSSTKRCRWRAPLLLLALPIFLLLWQHGELERVREQVHRGQAEHVAAVQPQMVARASPISAPESVPVVTPVPMPHRPPVPSPLPPAAPPSSSSSSSLSFVDGESIGSASPAQLCFVMPVRSSNLKFAVRNARRVD